MMFQYWFIDLYTMFPNYETDRYGMNEYTDSVWALLYKVSPNKMEHAHGTHTLHSIFKSSEVI